MKKPRSSGASQVIKHELKSRAPDDVRLRVIHYHEAKGKHPVEAGELSRSLAAVSMPGIKALLNQSEGRTKGGRQAGESKRAKAKASPERVVQLWDESTRPDRERAGIIAQRLGVKADTIRKIIRKAGRR